MCSISELSKFMFILGHIALKQLTHIEEIMNEIRRRRSRGQKKEKSTPLKYPLLTYIEKEKKTEAIEEELGVSAAATENEIESLQDKAEKEVVSLRSLVGTFGTCIDMICANAGGHFNVTI